MTAAENLARRIVERRAVLGLSQEDVAELGGPSISSLRAIENAQAGSFRSKTLTSLDSVLGWQIGTSTKLLAGEIEQPVEATPRQQIDGKTWRLNLGLTAHQAAKKTGVAYGTWLRIENGLPVRDMTVEQVRKVMAETVVPEDLGELEHWKRRALEAEAKLRKVADVLMGISGGVS